MPNCTAHFLLSERVLERIAAEERKQINLTAYHWGAQGPDFLFCHRYLPWQKGISLETYGTQIHDAKPSLVFDIMRKVIKRRESSIFRSYVMGFICHYALDSAAHPYVNMLAKGLLVDRPYETQNTLHGEIESALDTIILRHERGMLPNDFKLAEFFPLQEPVNRAIAQLYQELISSLFSVNVTIDQLMQAQKDANKIFGLLTDRSGLKRKLFQKIEQGKPHVITSHLIPLMENPEIDYANSGESEWELRGEVRRETFFDLFDQATEKAIEIQSHFDSADFLKLTNDIPFA